MELVTELLTSSFVTSRLPQKKSRTGLTSHFIFSKDRGWIPKPSSPHPLITLTATPSPSDHADFGHPVACPNLLRTENTTAVADTGCQCTCGPPSFVYKLGFRPQGDGCCHGGPLMSRQEQGYQDLKGAVLCLRQARQGVPQLHRASNSRECQQSVPTSCLSDRVLYSQYKRVLPWGGCLWVSR